jgi:hypothetical protein
MLESVVEKPMPQRQCDHRDDSEGAGLAQHAQGKAQIF